MTFYKSIERRYNLSMKKLKSVKKEVSYNKVVLYDSETGNYCTNTNTCAGAGTNCTNRQTC